MSVRFRKSVKILPGVRVNLSKSGPSLSIGGGGLTLNYSKLGVRTTADLPGGLYYTKLHGDADEKTTKSKTEETLTAEADSKKLDTDFFDRIRMSEDEEQFVKGLKEFAAGNAETALTHLSQATDIPDGAFLAGAVALSLEKYTESLQYLEKPPHKRTNWVSVLRNMASHRRSKSQLPKKSRCYKKLTSAA